jgi:hypothetical protein
MVVWCGEWTKQVDNLNLLKEQCRRNIQVGGCILDPKAPNWTMDTTGWVVE